MESAYLRQRSYEGVRATGAECNLSAANDRDDLRDDDSNKS